MFRHPRPAGQPGGPPGTRGNQAHDPQAGQAGTSAASTAGSCPRAWFDGTNHLAADTGGGPIARLWATALGRLVDFGYVKSTGKQRADQPAPDGQQARGHVRVERSPPTSPGHRLSKRDRGATAARHLLPGLRGRRARACTSPRRKALAEIRAGAHQDLGAVQRARRGELLAGFTEGGPRPVLSHHMVIRGGKDRELPPVPGRRRGTPASRDVYGTPRGPMRDAVQNTPIFEENPPDRFKGNRHHAGRSASFDPCLPCGVHMLPRRWERSWRRCIRRWGSPWQPERLRMWRRRHGGGAAARPRGKRGPMTSVAQTGERIEELLASLRARRRQLPP